MPLAGAEGPLCPAGGAFRDEAAWRQQGQGTGGERIGPPIGSIVGWAMSSIFRHLQRSSPTPGDDAKEDARLTSNSRQAAENDAREKASERAARSQAAENEARRQASDAEGRTQAAENEARRRTSDAEARDQEAENEARHLPGDTESRQGFPA